MAESTSPQYSLPSYLSAGSITSTPFSVTATSLPDPSSTSATFSTFHDNNSVRLQKIDNEQQEIKQSAVKALHQNSILAMHVIASGESPARTRLRMLRYLTGLPQPANKSFMTSLSEGSCKRD